MQLILIGGFSFGKFEKKQEQFLFFQAAKAGLGKYCAGRYGLIGVYMFIDDDRGHGHFINLILDMGIIKRQGHATCPYLTFDTDIQDAPSRSPPLVSISNDTLRFLLFPPATTITRIRCFFRKLPTYNGSLNSASELTRLLQGRRIAIQ